MHLAWKGWTQLKKLELLSAIALRNSYPSFMLSKLSACIHNSILFSARERAELNNTNPANLLVPEAGGIFSSGPPQRAESVEVIRFRKRFSGQSFSLFTIP